MSGDVHAEPSTDAVPPLHCDHCGKTLDRRRGFVMWHALRADGSRVPPEEIYTTPPDKAWCPEHWGFPRKTPAPGQTTLDGAGP
jgi:hypothetical protein